MRNPFRELYTIQEERKDGRKLLGYFIQYKKNGAPGYIAVKGQEEMLRLRKGTTSEALREEQAYWSIEVETLRAAQDRHVKIFGIVDRRTKDLYFIPLADFFDPAISSLHEGRKNRLERMVQVSRFSIRRATVKV